MKTQKLTFDQLHQDLEVLDNKDLNSIKGGAMTASELLAAIAENGVDKYVGNYHFGDGGDNNFTSFSFDSSTMQAIEAAAASGGGGGYGIGVSQYSQYAIDPSGNLYGGHKGSDTWSALNNLNQVTISTNKPGSNLLSGSLAGLALTQSEFALPVLAPIAEILLPLGIIGYIFKGIYDAQSSIYSYDRGQPWQEPRNPYNDLEGMNPFPNGDNFSKAAKAFLLGAMGASIYDEMKDYYNWDQPAKSAPNPQSLPGSGEENPFRPGHLVPDQNFITPFYQY